MNGCSMFKGLFSIWLVTLAATPFTAPFAICDLAQLLGHEAHHQVPMLPLRGPVAGTAAAVATVPALVRAVRPLRPAALLRVHVSLRAADSARMASRAILSPPERLSSVPRTVLRL